MSLSIDGWVKFKDLWDKGQLNSAQQKKFLEFDNKLREEMAQKGQKLPELKSTINKSSKEFTMIKPVEKLKTNTPLKTISRAEFTASQATFVDGSGALPSLSFISDLDTGIYRSGSDRLGFSCGTIKALELTSTQTFFQNSNSVLAPAMSFDGDTDTGFRRVTTKSVGIVCEFVIVTFRIGCWIISWVILCNIIITNVIVAISINVVTIVSNFIRLTPLRTK